MKKMIVGILLSVAASSAYASCESGYSIQTLSDDGATITLDDGSTWSVSDYDQADSSAWMEGEEILVCDDETFINKDEENEKVDVQLLAR